MGKSNVSINFIQLPVCFNEILKIRNDLTNTFGEGMFWYHQNNAEEKHDITIVRRRKM
jgi:hypothetical protein